MTIMSNGDGDLVMLLLFPLTNTSTLDSLTTLFIKQSYPLRLHRVWVAESGASIVCRGDGKNGSQKYIIHFEGKSETKIEKLISKKYCIPFF